MDIAARIREKVRPISELAEIASRLREQGETVVLAHGTFDLLHIGHVKHLKAARAEGTVLIVTLTADEYVSKGPGRPIFSENLRSEMLASLEYVDYVGIEHTATAKEAIRAIKPSIYIKGTEYENPEQDVTGQITAEREAVESHGGQIRFTNEETFSSSRLINRYLDVFDPPLQEYLNSLRTRVGIETLLGAFEAISHMRILVLGDAIVDEYVYAAPIGKSPKETIIATLYSDREEFAGGVFATGNHIANFCKDVEIVSVLGMHDSYEELIRASLKPNARLTALFRPGVPTTKKTRFVEPSYIRKMFEVYTMDDAPISRDLEANLEQLIRDRAPHIDAVVVNDFGHGMISPRIRKILEQEAKFLAINTQTNSGNAGYNLITNYRRADYIAIDAPEARLAARNKFGDLAREVIPALQAAANCERLVVTHGGHGCYVAGRKEPVVHIPAFTKTVLDTVGAGDAFFAVTSPLVAAGIPMEQVGAIGNAAGALKVGIVGHRKSIERVPLMKYLTTLLK
jgi:rfaE bifunctional protein nucleotidyltransferase chain/domain